jgi:hypothetical protein
MHGMRALRGRRTLLAVAAAVVAAGMVAVIVVASARSHDEPTRAQYLAAVAAICRAYGPKLDTIRPPDVAEPANVIDAVDRVLPILTAQLRRVVALEPPETLRPKVDRWLALQDRRLGILEKAQAAGQRQDFRTLSVEYVDFALAGTETGRLARELGIPHPPC